MKWWSPDRTVRFGITLIEVAVATVIIAVLVAITLPALRYARESARDAGLKADLRSAADAFTAYSADHAGLLPHFQPPREFDGDHWGVWPPYFDMHRFWPLFVGPYLGLKVDDPVFRPEPDDVWASKILMPCAFLADPAFWIRERRTFGPGQLVPAKLDRTSFPSDKTIAVYWPAGGPETARPGVAAAFVDGSAATVAPKRRVAGYPRGDGATHQPYASHFGDSPPMLHTLKGVLGRDRK